MAKLEVGFFLLAIFGVTINAVPLFSDQKFESLHSRANQIPSLGSTVVTFCFRKHERAKTFDFWYQTEYPLPVLYTGKTFLVDQANPKRQHLIITIMSQKFEYEVNFSENELQSSYDFCTTAKPVQRSNYL